MIIDYQPSYYFIFIHIQYLPNHTLVSVVQPWLDAWFGPRTPPYLWTSWVATRPTARAERPPSSCPLARWWEASTAFSALPRAKPGCSTGNLPSRYWLRCGNLKGRRYRPAQEVRFGGATSSTERYSMWSCWRGFQSSSSPLFFAENSGKKSVPR